MTTVIGFGFNGCGGGGDNSAPQQQINTEKWGFLIDSQVEGIDYTCGSISGTTDSNGKFFYDTTKCPNGIEFKLNNLSLGIVNPSKINSYLTIQELAGTARKDISDLTVQKIAVFLQSLDEDDNASNGILISQNIKNAITLDGNLADKTDNEITAEITKPTISKTVKDTNSALQHLTESTNKIDYTRPISTNSFSIPMNGAVNVGIYSWIILNFDEAMDAESITPQNITLDGNKTFLICNYNSTTKSALCEMADGVKFNENTKYTVTANVSNALNRKKRITTSFTTGKLDTKPLLRTGQTTSYVNYDDGYYANQGLGKLRSFTKINQLVTDNVTGLIWQDDIAVTSSILGINTSSYCNNLDIGSYSDWRLPTIEELATISSKGQYSPAIFNTFSNVSAEDYWSSTTAYLGMISSGYKWTVGFGDGGSISWSGTTSGLRVRCVRTNN